MKGRSSRDGGAPGRPAAGGHPAKCETISRRRPPSWPAVGGSSRRAGRAPASAGSADAPLVHGVAEVHLHVLDLVAVQHKVGGRPGDPDDPVLQVELGVTDVELELAP